MDKAYPLQTQYHTALKKSIQLILMFKSRQIVSSFFKKKKLKLSHFGFANLKSKNTLMKAFKTKEAYLHITSSGDQNIVDYALLSPSTYMVNKTIENSNRFHRRRNLTLKNYNVRVLLHYQHELVSSFNNI